MRTSVQAYYRLAKPGIVYGNSITAAAGFLLAAKTFGHLELVVPVLAGIALLMASGCVFNNYIDRGIDKKMTRTKSRALVTGVVCGSHALWYGAILGLLGFGLLAISSNVLTVVLGVLALGVYIGAYGYAKRRSVHGTLVGSIAGALPPVAGYTALSGQLDGAAFTLFALLTLWQMPHFYAIGIFRAKDYAAAELPILPLQRGNKTAKRYILGYIAAFIAVLPLLSVWGYAGWLYLAVASVLGCIWLYIGFRNFTTLSDAVWAKRMFFTSLIVLIGLSSAVGLDVALS